jgi:hypothetical protein
MPMLICQGQKVLSLTMLKVNYKNLPKLKSENLEIFYMGAIPRKYYK